MVLTQVQRAIVCLVLAAVLSACQKEQAQQNNNNASADTSAVVRSCILSAGWSERIPYNYRAPDGSAFGIDIDVLTYLADKAGCAIRYRYIPERQQMERLAAGDVELLLGQYQSPELNPSIALSDAYRVESYDLHVLSGSPVRRDDLSMLIMLDFKLGLTQGYAYEEPVISLREDIIHKGQFVLADDSESNINNLLSGKVDGILEDNTVVHAVADRELVDSKVEHMGINGGAQPVYLVFNSEKVPADIITRFNRAIAQMKKDNVYQHILDRHS